MTLADILVVMNGGQVEQLGNPLDVYQRPATTFVASFIGAPPMNLMPLRDAGGFQANGGDGILGVRAGDLLLSDDQPAGGLRLDLLVEAIERVGAETYIYGLRSQAGDVSTVSARPGE